MNSDHNTHRWVGCPIRISTDQSLLAAPRGFSQRATSFIASWCQGIHRMPLSRSKPPTHAQEPSTPGFKPAAHETRDARPVIPSTHSSLNTSVRKPAISSASEHASTLLPRVRPTQITARTDAHQPLHTDKEHISGQSKPARAPRASNQPDRPIRLSRIDHCPHPRLTPRKTSGGGGRSRTDDPLLAKQVLYQLSYAPNLASPAIWWAREDLNLRPHAYQACALTN